MKTLYKPILIILLALLACLPKWVLAVDWSGTVTGVDVSSSSVTITLTGDTNLNGWIIVRSGGTVTLDLNGYILKRTNANERVAIIVDNGVLIIKDSRPSASHAGSLYTVGSYTKIWQPVTGGAGGNVTLTGGIITGGRYDADSGGCIQVNGTGKLSIQGGTLAGNVCSTHHGGAVALFDNSSFEMSGGKILYNGAVSGGGVMAYWGTTSFTMTGGEISYNVARGNGGGVYCASASINIKKGDFIGNEAVYISSTDSGGDGGAIEIHAGYHGVFGASGAVNIKNNKARIGGGICAEGNASLTFYANTTIQNNTATHAGGGVRAGDSYAASDSHVVDIYGVTITGNTVTAGGTAGGLHTGYARVRIVGTGVIKVYDNKVGTTPSDIYIMPDPNYNPAGSSYYPRDKIEVTVSGIQPVKVGIDRRVLQSGNDQRFFYSTTASYLTNVYNNIKSGAYSVYSNKTQFWKVKAYSSGNYMYFTNPWSSTQQNISTSTESLVNGVYQIGSVQQLTAFLCRVNGITTNNTASFGTGNVSAKGILTADINMSGHYWVPIGNETAYKGTFDGNGYCIYNLTLEGDNPTNERGMFGQLTTGCEVKNVQLHSYNYTITRTAGSGAGGWGGGIASRLMGGTIYNCVVDGTLTGVSATHMGGLVGTVYSGTTVHSCSAMATLSGSSTMGGLVGNQGGTLRNSFANPTFTSPGSSPKLGGLAGINSGTIENCYMRYTPLFAGSNSGTIRYCYGPSGTTTSGTGQTNCGWFTNPVAPYLYTRTNDNTVGPSSLLALLNANRGTGAEWKRTTAGGYSGGGNINGDFPIHKYSNYTCVASTNGKVLDYAKTLDIMLTRHNTSNTTINLWASGSTSKATGSGVVVYIDENISLLQSTSNAITAYTCQTIPAGHNWHFISSSLSNSGIGFNYGITTQVGFNWSENPCNVTFSSTDNEALFPHDVPNINKVDLYAFYEPEYHWINLKRNSNSHWHMNAQTVPINYTNETTLTPGKGYLMSIDKSQLLQNKGTLNNGDVTVTLGYTPAQAWAGLVGYNLIGNPYQSYLDFTKFKNESANTGLWYDNSKGYVEPTYAIYDAEMGGYVQYKEGASRGSKAASGILNMHQGFMVRSRGATSAKFTNDMRTNTAGSGFREEQPSFPLVNLTVTDDEGVNDFAVLELGRDANSGAEKLRANDCKGWIYLHHNDDDYGILFRSEVSDYQPLWFEATEAGTYTLSWETANAEFDELTLVDNITGVVTDMLTHNSYVFEANPDQYKSRFKIVVGDWKDVEENNGLSTETFAYYADGEIHLVGADACDASLQIVDMLGQVIRCSDVARNVSTNGMAPGVYILRLSGNNGTRTQKIVIE